jgi:hypothetical protein
MNKVAQRRLQMGDDTPRETSTRLSDPTIAVAFAADVRATQLRSLRAR